MTKPDPYSDDTPERSPGDAPVTQRPAVDRGISPISGRLGGRNSKLVTLAALGLGCGAFLFATWDRDEADPAADRVSTEPARQVVPFEPARREIPPPLLTDPRSDAPPLISGERQVPALEMGAAYPASSGPSRTEQRQQLTETAQRAPVIAYSRPGPASGLQGGSPGIGPYAAGGAGVATQTTELDALRRTSPIAEVRAGTLSDRRLLLTAGASLPCILQTAMDSGTPGFVSCVLPLDVYSDNGAVVLMERGTRVLGEYQGGLQQGRSRLFVLWTRAVTPKGVAIALASPASDALGRAGFDGRVDNHFWDRFGGALLLSLVDDGLYAAVGRDDAVRNTARVPSDAAGVALQNSVGIPPTLKNPQGSEVSIFVAQDLNFADVYRLSAR